MARLDARLLPLLETLSASGADWLAIELVEGIGFGRIAEEPVMRLTERALPSEDA
jgi:hypothetical protein